MSKKIKREELKKEQREYSRQIIKRIDSGELTKEEVPEVIRNLEKYPDRSKALYLITKLYQGYYGTKEAFTYLTRYSKIADLTVREMAEIENIRFSIVRNKDRNIIKERQLKVKKRNKEANIRYRNRVKQYLKERKENEGREEL